MNVDTALRQRAEQGKPIRVGIVGAGATGRAIALQMATPPAGIRLAAISNRTIATGERSFREAGVTEWGNASSAKDAESIINSGRAVLTDDPSVLTDCSAIDIIVEVTGTVDAAAHVAMRSFDQGKPVVLVNAELDSLLGPILKQKADAAGVVLTHTDGDEPGVAMTLVRYVRTLGLNVVAAGNIKGMVDYYRTPATQEKFAAAHDQDVRKVTSFADATKLSMETTVLANATGFQCAKRGMVGPSCAKVQDLAGLLPPEAMLATGIVDYSVGAAPHTGGFVVVHEPNKLKQVQLAYYKMGDGPFYVLHTPFHLPHLQIMSTIGRAVILKDATVAPLAGPSTEVVAVAKRDLKAGEKLDGIGGFCTYGLIENSSVARSTDALPIALSDNCVLKRDIPKDATILASDVEQPVRDPLIEKLWREQCARWSPKGDTAGRSAGPRGSVETSP